ncbi:MAG: MFS transporter [Deltaproteobacteria bacterium RIFOXYA12_FULL_58_15]|nr:MAG: MFS transporter [Deltaproteobacteria bacterium RIFOXYA12_FULL_58_15]OGR14190.1 MAG: MFS transporter [Deltaproteobacteria bacterium RIFOXYB12_FULL_58_9]
MFRQFFRPAPHIPQLPDDEVKKQYPRYRWRMLESTFLGYATFYIVRNNLSTVAKEMGDALHYDHSQIGDILALTAVSYGVGKFFMGALSDRSNPQRFMPAGLLITALINFVFGSTSSYPLHLALWSMNGLAQGMGWPPCGRTIGHWFSVKERGTVFAIWNIAHNVGGGVAGVLAAWAAGSWGWQSAFFVPGALALLGAAYLAWRLRDTPQSVGLPPVEIYKDAAIDKQNCCIQKTDHERELGTRELLVDMILKNRLLWIFALANFFVYIVRYSMLDWGPTYLKEVKQATLHSGGLAILVLEFGGIPSTLLLGWASDKLGGRRGMVSLLCMIPILAAFIGLKENPPGQLWLDMVFLGIIGFFIYPPVMLLGVSALDLTSKKAVGAAAGFVGLFGYIGRMVQAKALGFMAANEAYGWDGVMLAILGATVGAIVLLIFTWKVRPCA